jgi:hypothetical protein
MFCTGLSAADHVVGAMIMAVAVIASAARTILAVKNFKLSLINFLLVKASLVTLISI